MTDLTPKTQRDYYLDWIRVGIVLILIPFHTAVSFSHLGNAYIYTPSPKESWLFIFMSDFFNLWFMRLLFFISGIATYYSLRKRTTREYLRERFNKLVIPTLFLLLTIGPLSGFILAREHYQFTGSFFKFYPLFFLEKETYLFWGHMWFCVYLYIFSLVSLPLLRLLKRRPQTVNRVNHFLAQKVNIMLPMGLIMILEMTLRPHFPGFQSFIGDWANVMVHFTFFLLGYIFCQSRETLSAIMLKRGLFLTLSLLSTLFYLLIKRVSILPFNGPIFTHIQNALWGSAAYSWVMFFIGFFRKRFNRNNSLLTFLSRRSFSLYIFHYFIITLLNQILLGTELHYYAQWALTTLGTYPVFTLLFLLLERVKPLKKICAIG